MIAHEILVKAKSIGLDVFFKNITPSDGSCFYHAVLEGLTHNFEVNNEHCNFIGATHNDLHLNVINYLASHTLASFV